MSLRFKHKVATLLLVTTAYGQAEIVIDPATGTQPLKTILEQRKNWHSETISLYSQSGYSPVWIVDNKVSKAAEVALSVLKTADTEGLNPTDYSGAEKALKDFQSNKISAEEADVLITNELIRYINDIRVGRIPPGSTARTIKLKSPKTDAVKILQAALQDSSGNYQKLQQLAPDLNIYKQLRQLLAEYRQLAKDHSTVPELKKEKLKLGSKDPEVITLRKILNILGDFKGSEDSQDFDSDLEDALKSFQDRHTLDADGVVGASTRKALNMSLHDRINKIIINMERLRWLPDELGGRYIMVNVGGFEVVAVNNDKVELRIKAIVGKTATRTPLFYAPLKNVILNPSWGVPAGIMQRDKLPKIINDPDYVRRSGFTVYDSSGSVIDPDQADWEGNGMSYRLRQSPGAHNALGRIKLNIENPYTIYLHGTPEEKLFKNAARAFSSGCIRLQKPADLAAWVLKGVDDWSLSKIDTSIKSGGTKAVNVKDSIQVYFTYMTVWVDDENKAHFSDDVYNLDPTLIKLLHLQDEVTVDTMNKKLKPRFA